MKIQIKTKPAFFKTNNARLNYSIYFERDSDRSLLAAKIYDVIAEIKRNDVFNQCELMVSIFIDLPNTRGCKTFMIKNDSLTVNLINKKIQDELN